MRASKELNSRLRGFAVATHFGPTVLVVTVSFCLALTQYSGFGSLEVAGAILMGQCVVGWSNDLIDLPLDAAAARQNKPLVSGKIAPAELKRAITGALFLCFLLSYLGPLGVKGTGVHALGLLSATLYNLKLKNTWFSVLPYIFSFGALPWAIYLSAGKAPSTWLVFGFIFFASAFHFLNVVKDLEWDLRQGVNGLPQRLGKGRSIAIAVLLILAGVAVIIFKWRLLLDK